LTVAEDAAGKVFQSTKPTASSPVIFVIDTADGMISAQAAMALTVLATGVAAPKNDCPGPKLDVAEMEVVSATAEPAIHCSCPGKNITNPAVWDAMALTDMSWVNLVM
jgi:hypothetical protein